MWDAEAIFEHFANTNKVVAYDCRGHGKSDKPTSYSLSDHMTDAFELMNSLGFSEFNLIGVSMGSYISQGMAIARPERIKKMVLVVPKSNGKTSSIGQILAENAELLKTMDDDGKSAFMNKLVIHNSDALKKYPDFLKSKLTINENKAATSALTNFDFRNELRKVTAKTLVISGKFDRLNPPEEGRICAQEIVDGKFQIMQYSAHAPTIEEPGRFIKIVDEFLLG
jgi:3-oxoadipate enol-lactonase